MGSRFAESGIGMGASSLTPEKAGSELPDNVKLLAGSEDAWLALLCVDSTKPGCKGPLGNSMESACPRFSTGATGPNLPKAWRNSSKSKCRKSDAGSDEPKRV